MPTTIQFARLSRVPTPFRVNSKREEVFVPDDLTRCAPFFRPTLTVDLSHIRPEWRGLAHFVYFQMGLDGVTRFQLEGDRYRYLGDFSECDPDAPLDDDVEVTWKAPFVELIQKQVPLLEEDWTPSPDAIAATRLVYPDERRRSQYWYTLGELAGDPFPWNSADFFFGHTPHWTQRDETPLAPDGQPMAFVGQMRPNLLTNRAADFTCYLFYSPQHRLVTQITQAT
jgi:hypothetical protein